jgi:RNA polymerase sigma factor (sigma-70 family)
MHELTTSTCLAGEDSVIDQLYRAHAPAIFAYLCQHVATRSDAEDLLLDVFVTALEQVNLDALTEDRQVAWLWRVARNKAIDHHRRSARRPTLELDHIAAQLADHDSGSPEHSALRRDEAQRLHMLLTQLTPLQRNVLRLRFADDLRCSEIALVLGKKESAVRVLLMRTLRLLRASYIRQDSRDAKEG